MKSATEPEQLKDILERVILTLPLKFLYQHKNKTHNNYKQIASFYRDVFIKHGLEWNNKCVDIIRATIQSRCPRQEITSNSEELGIKYVIRALLKIPNTTKGVNFLNALNSQSSKYKEYFEQASNIIKNDKKKVESIKEEALQELLINEEQEIESALIRVFNNEDNWVFNGSSELEHPTDRQAFLAQPIKSLPDRLQVFIDKNQEAIKNKKPVNMFDLTRFFPEFKTKKETNENNVQGNLFDLSQ